MNTPIEELACLYVLDRLDPAERAVAEARLLLDPELAALVLEVEASLSRRVRGLEQKEPPAGLLADVEARIDRLTAGSAPARAFRRARPWATAARWGIAAAIAISAGIVAVQSLRRPDAAAGRPYVICVGLDSLGSTLAELPLRDRAPNADASFVQLASLAERFWEKPDDLPVRQDGAGQRGRGYALFDPGSSQGFIAIRQLPLAGAGKQYHLWLLDAATGRIREACVLPAAGGTSGLYFFHVAPGDAGKPGRLDFFVTSEDASAPEVVQPRGEVVLGDRRI